jgi:hypothetical protein
MTLSTCCESATRMKCIADDVYMEALNASVECIQSIIKPTHYMNWLCVWLYMTWQWYKAFSRLYYKPCSHAGRGHRPKAASNAVCATLSALLSAASQTSIPRATRSQSWPGTTRPIEPSRTDGCRLVNEATTTTPDRTATDTVEKFLLPPPPFFFYFVFFHLFKNFI